MKAATNTASALPRSWCKNFSADTRIFFITHFHCLVFYSLPAVPDHLVAVHALVSPAAAPRHPPAAPLVRALLQHRGAVHLAAQEVAADHRLAVVERGWRRRAALNSWKSGMDFMHGMDSQNSRLPPRGTEHSERRAKQGFRSPVARRSP